MKKEFADEIRAQVRKDRQRIVLSSSRDSSFIHLGLVSIFAYTVFDEKNILDITNHIVIGLYLMVCIRFLVSTLAKTRNVVSKITITIHNLSLFFYALGWGVLTYQYLAYYGLASFLSMIIVMISTSVGAGGASSLSISPKVFLTYGLGIYGPTIFFSALHLNEKYYLLLFVSYLLFFASQARQSFLSAKMREQLVASEEEVKIERARAEQSARLAALGEMAGGISHEINSPLAAITGYLALLEIKLKKEVPESDKILDLTSKIKTVIDRIVKIITNLRTFASDKDNSQFEKNSMKKIIEDTSLFCMNRFQNDNVKFTVEIPEDFTFECQAQQLTQVLLNLLNNSFYAIQDSANKWIHIQAHSDGKTVEIAVTDSGLGIAKDIRDKIMQPFFTTKEIGQGTGLGLSTAQGIIKTHHGRFFYNETSKNTQFVIQLPVVQPIANTATVTTLNANRSAV